MIDLLACRVDVGLGGYSVKLAKPKKGEMQARLAVQGLWLMYCLLHNLTCIHGEWWCMLLDGCGS